MAGSKVQSKLKRSSEVEAHVVGDIHHQSLSIEGGAYFDGRSKQTRAAKGPELDKLARKLLREIARKNGGSVTQG